MKLRIVFVLLLGLLSGQLSTAHAADKTIGIIVFDGVLTSDVTAPLEVFGAASKLSWFSDYKVVAINIENKPTVTTEEGLTLSTDSWIGEKQSLDVLLVPSRYDMSPVLKNQQLIGFIKEHGQSAAWVASNCSGSQLLAEAGLLDGKQATTWAGGEKKFQRRYPKVNVIEDQNVVVDDRFITSNGSVVSYQAALMLLKRISSEGKAKEVAEAIQYARLSTQPF